MFPRLENISVGICVSWVGEQITRGMYFPVGEHIIRDMCFVVRGTQIIRDMYFIGRGTHITRVFVSLVGDMCFLDRGVHITSDVGFPGRGTDH